MTVLAATRTPRPEIERELGVERVSLTELLARSDFVTLHVPYGPETEHLMGAARIRRHEGDCHPREHRPAGEWSTRMRSWRRSGRAPSVELPST